MGFIQPQSIGPRPTPQSSQRHDSRANLSTEVMGILNDIGVKQIRTIRIQQGRHILPSLKELATLPLTHDQQNALQGLGLHGVLLAMFSEETDINYKETLKDLHEHLLGKEQIALLQDAFGIKSTPILLEDDKHNGVFLLQESVKELEKTRQS
jgi:hypothetical protein